MTKTIFKKISLSKEHEEALNKATSESYLSKVKDLDKKRTKRFKSIRDNQTISSSTMLKAIANL